MSKDTYFTQYNSPNIVIVPTKSLSNDPPQKTESEADSKSRTDDTNKSIPILIQGSTSNSESCTYHHSNANMNTKNNSWASNYLQSTGITYEKSVLNRRGKMNTSQDNAMFLTQDPTPAADGQHQYADVNLQPAAPNIHYAFGQSSSIVGNNTTFTNYNNIASATTGVMPASPYLGTYENNNYYYSQPMNTVQSCCSTCYGTVQTLPNTYGQPLNVVNNTSSMITYYDPNATSTLAPAVNLPYEESYLFMNINTQTTNNVGQSVNIDNNTNTSITSCEDNRCPTPLFDEKLLTPQLGINHQSISSVTKITDVKLDDIMNDKNLSSVSNSTTEDKACNCMCSIRNPDSKDKQNIKIQNNADKKIEQLSSVKANEKAFRDFLLKLKIARPSEKEKKRTSTLSKSPLNKIKVKNSKTNSKEKSSVQENEKAFRKLLQKLKMERQSETEKSANKQVIKKKTSTKDQTSSHEKTMSCSQNKSSKESKQKEEEQPKFIKTKYVDEQEPEYKPIKKARLESNCELEKYSKTKIISTKYIDEHEPDYKCSNKSRLHGHEIKKYSATKSKSTKYLDEQEPACKPIKKAKNNSDYDLKKYWSTMTIPTKYVDKQEPEYEPVKKQRNESDYELKKYSNTKTISTKYVDDKKHEYKHIKKTRIDSSSEPTKRSTKKYDTTHFKMKRSRDEEEASDKFSKKYDSDYKIRTYKTESTKYYKYKTEDCEDTHKQTPVKSVVKISKTRELKKSPIYNSLEKEDLRDKLSRKLTTKNKEHNEEILKRKSSKESNDNLIITVNNNITENEISPVNITDNRKTKTESSKKINLVINIVYKQPGSRSESDKSDSDSPQTNVDLSFLDDFNVDEIVASLNKTEKINQNAESEASNVATSFEGRTKKTDDVLIKKDNLEISKAQIILEEGNLLNNLLSKEANLIDSLRLIHEEIQIEKRSCIDYELSKSFPGRQSGLSQKDYKCGADALLETDIKKETDLDKSMTKNKSEESKNADVNNISPSINTSQSPLSVFMEQFDKIDHTKDLSEPIDNGLLKNETEILIRNDIKSFDHHITEDKRGDSELLQILEDTKEDEKQVIQTIPQRIPQTAYVKDKLSNDMGTYKDGITSIYEADKKEQSELLKILEDTKEDEIEVIQTQSNSTPQTKHILGEISSDMITYDDDITSFDKEDKKRQTEILTILEDTKEDETEIIQTQTNNISGAARLLDKVSKDMNIYVDDITFLDEEDKSKQSELFKTEDTKKGENEVIKKQTNVSNTLTIIDLSSDDSNDSYKTKRSKDKSLDDVFIVEEKSGQNLIETIDLTAAENLSNQTSTQSLETAKVLNNKENKKDSSNPLVKGNIDVQKTYNKGIVKRDMLADETIQKKIYSKNMLVKQVKVQDAGVCLDSNESKYTGAGTETKIVTAIKDAIDSLNAAEACNRALDKLNVEAKRQFPARNTIKETFDIGSNVKDREVSEIQDVIRPSQIDTHPSDKSISLSTEACEILTKDCKEIKESVNSANVTNSENIANCEKEKHENEKGHIKLAEDATMESIRNHINKSKEFISDAANNTKIEETVLLQTEVDGKNEESSPTAMIFENSVTNTSIEFIDCKKVQATEKDDSQKICNTASCDAQKEDRVAQNEPQIIEPKTEVNIDEKKNTVEERKSPKAKVQTKTEASTPKTMPSTSGTKINTTPSNTKKDKTNFKTVDVKVENANKTPLSLIAEKLEHEMYKCFNQKYKAQGLIHSGTFSKVFHFTSFSGRHYAVKSYNDWHSVYKYAEKKDMLVAMQEGLMRHNYGGVYLINTFSLQGHLCLLMDYYPKNLKQALEENEKPFHINEVQHLARQLVGAVMLLKSHDLVHLDIKPTHILLSYKNDRLKLCGFDSARYINKIPSLPNLGSANYRPPEVIIGYKIGFDADVWATAAVMYEMATGVKLFDGIHNNDILFKQMCTLGALPVEMLHRSRYSNLHFTGCSFKRVKGNNQNKMNIITKFYKSKRLETTVITAYNENWLSSATPQELAVDQERIASFTTLLRDMLEVDPGDRMPIQFVNAHPFMTYEC